MEARELLDDLLMQQAWIRHWQDDIRCGLKPTEDSLRNASDAISAAIAKAKGATE